MPDSQPNLRVTSKPPLPASPSIRIANTNRQSSRPTVYTKEMYFVCIPPPSSQATRSVTNHRLLLGYPDPFAVATVNGEQTQTTQVTRKTLNPYWNEQFDLCGPLSLAGSFRGVC